MKIAIVILNWNGKKLLEQFLPSVVANTPKGAIYVADNASTDDSINYVTQYYPTVNIIQNDSNGGYAKGYNDALEQVDADILCLLNNDVEVTEGWIEPIIKIFQNEPNTAILQPKILDYTRRDYFEYAGAAGGFIDKFGYPYCRGRIFETLEKDDGQYNDETSIFWASGACFFVRKSIFNALNGFDSTFFAHMEEIDFCWRAKNMGCEVKYTYKSVVYHLGGGTLNNQNPKKTFLNFRNSLLALFKNANGNLWAIVCLRLILDGLAGMMFLTKLRPHHTLAIIKAHLSFYGRLPFVLNQRKSQKSKIKYYKIVSIVKSYFMNNKRTFTNL